MAEKAGHVTASVFVSFPMVLWIDLQCVILASSGHTHLLFYPANKC